MNPKNYRIGTLFAILSALCWSFTGVLGKRMAWDAISILGSRGLIAALFLGWNRGGFFLKPSKATWLGAFGVVGTSVFYLSALSLTTAANAIALEYAMPAFVILLCWMFYHKLPRREEIITTICVFLGVLLCTIQGMRVGSVGGDLLALASGLAFALVFFCSRLPNTKQEDYAYLGNLISALFVIHMFFDPNVGKNPMDWFYGFLMGLAQTGGYFFFCKATSRIQPLTAAITSNIEPVLNPIWVFLFIGETPGLLSILGAVIVLTTVTIYSIRSANP